MKKIIHKLRQKSHEDRRQVLHAYLLVCIVILGLLFSFSLKANFRENNKNIKSDFKDFDNFKKNLSDGLENFSNN